MIKYFKYERETCNYTVYPNTHAIVEKINDYAKENNLKIIGATTDGDRGIFVIFEPVNLTN